jgi:hypothetical protein
LVLAFRNSFGRTLGVMPENAPTPDQVSDFERLASDLGRASQAAERLRGSLQLVGAAEAAELLGIGVAALWERRAAASCAASRSPSHWPTFAADQSGFAPTSRSTRRATSGVVAAFAAPFRMQGYFVHFWTKCARCHAG